MTFEELFRQWYVDKKTYAKPGTAALYATSWAKIAPYISDVDVCAFDKSDAKALLARLRDSGLAAHTIRDRMAVLRNMLKYAALDLQLPIQPTEWSLRMPKSEPKALQRYTEAEAYRVIRYVSNLSGADLRRDIGVLVSITTGLRIGEVCGLRYEDVDFKHNVISVRRTVNRIYEPIKRVTARIVGTTKTRAGYRDVPLLPVLKQALRALYKGNTSIYIVSGTDTPLDPRVLREKFKKLQQRLGLPHITFHGLRHTFASMLVEAGGDVKTISIILGHSTVAMTLNLYVHPSEDAKRKAVSRAFKGL